MADYKSSANFCIHFARGCCAWGHNCNYYHRIPSLKECEAVIQSQDIFGRSRHARFRDDMQGIGSFMNETRTLYISDFNMPHGDQAVSIMYEILWRYFNVFGEIEVIFLYYRMLIYVQGKIWHSLDINTDVLLSLPKRLCKIGI
jgi:hypothetical protein